MLYLSNKGLVEAGALTLLGASVKSSEKIGKFGSGFKYAIATLIREGYELRIWSGLSEIKIETRPEVFRDTTFQVLYVDGERTSITTNTGVEWKVRDAIREIWSNAIDEGGEMRGIDSMNLREGFTTIGIELKGEVADMVESWDMYFAHSVPAMHENHNGRILKQALTNYYRRGIWICEDREKPGLFSYDFTDIELPESRKIKSHSASYEVYATLSHCFREDIFEHIIANIETESMERYAFQYWGLGSTGLKALFAAFSAKWDFIGAKRNHSKISGRAMGKRVLWLSDEACSALSKLNLPRIEDNIEYNDSFTPLPWPIGYRDRVMVSINLLKSFGVDLTPFKLTYAEFNVEKFNDTPIALADMKTRTCVLSSRAFEVGPDMLMKALVEEWTHLEHNVTDCTTAQQHVYLNLIVSLIERNK